MCVCVCVCVGICLPEGGGKGVPRPAHQSPHQRHVSPACVCRAEEAYNLLPPHAEHVQRTAAGEPETDTGRGGGEGGGREGEREREREKERKGEREKRGKGECLLDLHRSRVQRNTYLKSLYNSPWYA